MNQAELPPQGTPVRRIPIVARIAAECTYPGHFEGRDCSAVGELSIDAAGVHQLTVCGWTFRYRSPTADDQRGYWTRCAVHPPNQVAEAPPNSPLCDPFPDLRRRYVRIGGGVLYGDAATGNEIWDGHIVVKSCAIEDPGEVCVFKPAHGSGFREPSGRRFTFATGQYTALPDRWY